jgi:hypothetical protein
MINKRELRIGNIVASPKHGLAIATIAGIATNDIVMLEEVSTYDFFSDVQPIPLTPDWLDKLGIRYKEGLGYSYPFAENFNLYLTKGVFRDCQCTIMQYSEGEELLKHIKYVHQFQNLYFALTGEELTIRSLQP